MPFIPHSALPAYLDDLVRRITELDTNLPQRQELSALAFKVVVEDLPDVSKRLGIEWWLEWRDRFEGRIGLSTELKARL